ncbi:MAG: tripartite tricarboxylate transporter substrate binding protein [Chloroflexota bacterium]
MARKHLLGLCVTGIAALTLTAVACSAPAAPAPTAAPAKATAAPAAAPTTAPAAAPTKAPEAAKPAAAAPAAPAAQKPAGFPSKAVTLIVPWDAGGSTDVGFRLLQAPFEKALGGSIEIVNKPGAGSQVGVTELAKAKPDGYTIGNISAPAVITQYLDPERKAAFTFDSFAPVGLHVYDVGAVAVAPDSKYKSIKDIVEDAKANPEKIKVGTTGVMGDDHLAILQLQRLAGVKFAIVHFTGGAPEMTALYGGHVDVIFDNVGTYTAPHKASKMRVVGVMDKQRVKYLSDVPTLEEQGYKLYSSSSRGLAAPKGTPKEIVWYLSQAMDQAIKDPEIGKKMDDQGLLQRYMNPDEFTKYWQDFEQQVKPLMDDAKATQK